MIDSIQNILVQVSDFLWSYIIITVLICCALFFTWRTRFVQFRLIREMIRLLLHPDKVQPEEIGHDELSMEVKVDGEMKHISSFQAFVVALASRIGTGNLAGVATAVSIGGPGAVFWMWMLALLGSASAFIESTLAQLYKRKGKTSFYGGPAYYMKYGLGKGYISVTTGRRPRQPSAWNATPIRDSRLRMAAIPRLSSSNSRSWQSSMASTSFPR